MINKWKIYDIFDKNIIAGTTIKDSVKPYNFSLALHTGENKNIILKNRQDFMSNFDDNFKFLSLKQIHSNKIVNVDEVNFYKQRWMELDLKADGFVTSKKNIILNILTADCIAIIASDNKAQIIGAAHAGWRGVKNNIAINLIKEMKKNGANKNDIKFAISPSIRGCCYEVGEDVAKEFYNYKDALIKISKDKYYLDISLALEEQLISFGIKKENIEISKYCTSCHNKNYFSYRKEKACSGRFITFIGIKED